MFRALVLATITFGALSASDHANAPETFRVRLETTKGAIVIDCVRAWAPHGVDRF